MFNRDNNVPMFGMSLLALSLAGIVASGLSGCNTISQEIVITAAGFNNIVNALNTPAGAQAIANLKVVSSGIVCGLAQGAALVGAVAQDVKATKTVNGAKIALMTSTTLCAAAGGTVVAVSP